MGNHSVHVIHTPGHSAGHCSFYFPDIGIVYLGDIDLSSFGPFYGYLDSHIDLFIKSIDRVKKLDFNLAVTSHKEVFRDRSEVLEKLDRYRDKIFEREDKLLEFLKQDRTLEEIVAEAIIYGTFPEPKAMYELMEKTMIAKHLERLISSGRITATPNGYIAK